MKYYIICDSDQEESEFTADVLENFEHSPEITIRFIGVADNKEAEEEEVEEFLENQAKTFDLRNRRFH